MRQQENIKKTVWNYKGSLNFYSNILVLMDNNILLYRRASFSSIIKKLSEPAKRYYVIALIANNFLT